MLDNLFMLTESFQAHPYLWSKYDVTKLRNYMGDLSQECVNLNRCLNQFSTDYTALTKKMGSTQWNDEARVIARVTGEAATQMKKVSTAFITDVTQVCDHIAENDGRLSTEVNDAKEAMASALQTISTIK